MANSLQLEIITPSRQFYKGDVEIVIVRTLDGDEGFMANHSWACKLLADGELWIREAETKEYKVAAISGGFIDVKDTAVIFTDAAEWPDEIDVEKVKAEMEKAEESLSSADSPEDKAVAKKALTQGQIRLNVKDGGVWHRH